jgi:putative transposon-encoded protein
VAEERILKNFPQDDESAPPAESPGAAPTTSSSRVKFEIYGEEMIEKHVKASGNSGRVYLPPDWVGHKVKVIRID